MSGTHIIILAAGKGTRMKSDLPKVLCKICGKPMIKHLLKSVEEICEKPTIIIGYKGEDVIKELGDKYHYIWQREQLGTGHAIMCAKKDLNKDEIENIVVFLGDHPLISAKTIEQLIEYHQKNNSIVTLSTVIAPNFEGEFERFYHYGRIIRQDDGSVDKIIELKDTDEKQKNISEVNVSYFCFNAKWLWENIEKLQNKNASSEYYLTDMIEAAVVQGKKVGAMMIENPIEGFGANTAKELGEMEKYIK